MANSNKNNKTGESIKKAYDFVVVATGIYIDPFIPEYPAKEDFKGQVLHSSEYKSPSMITNSNVLVVGFGKSSLDIAGEAAKFAKKVHLVYRRTHWPIPFNIFNIIDVRRIFLTRAANAFLPPYQKSSKGIQNGADT